MAETTYFFGGATLGGGVSFEGSVHIGPDGAAPHQWLGSVSLNDRPAVIGLPGQSGLTQEAGIEVYVDGELVETEGPITVSRHLREVEQQFQFVVPLEEWGVGPFGDPWAALGPPTGLSEVDVVGVYRDDLDGRVYRIPLITGGIVVNVERVGDSAAGYSEVHNGLDRARLFSRALVTIVLQPGHGLPIGRVCRKLLEAAGEDRTHQLEDGTTSHHALQFVDASPIASCQELLDVDGRAILWDRDGHPANPPFKPPTYQPIATLTEDDILDASPFRSLPPDDVVTEVHATGSRQVTSDEACALETTHDPDVETFATFAVWEAKQKQTAFTCALTPVAGSELPREQLESRTVGFRVTYCDRVIYEERQRWGYYAKESARYVWDRTNTPEIGDGEWACSNASPHYLNADAVAQDDSPAYFDRHARWAMTSKETVRHHYRAPGLFRSEAFPVAYDGRYQGSVVEEWGHHNPEVALMSRTIPTQPYLVRDGIKATGGKRPVRDGFEQFRVVGREHVFVEGDAYFLTRRSTVRDEWAPRPGGQTFQYADGTTSQLDTATLHEVARSVEQWTKSGDVYAYSTQTTEQGAPRPRTVRTTVPALEPMEYLPGWEPLPEGEVLDAEEQALAAVAAAIGDNEPLKVIVTVGTSISDNRLGRVVKTSLPYCESLDQLISCAQRIVELSMSGTATYQVQAWFNVAEGDVIELFYRPHNIDARRVVVEGVTHSRGDADDTPITALEVRIWPDS